MRLLKYEGKTKEEAISKCLKEQNLTEKDLYMKESQIVGGLFKGKKVIVETLLKEDVICHVKNFIKDLSNLMGITINSEVRESEGVINVLLVTDQNAIIIGKDGCTLEAIQILIRQSINKQTGMNIRINVDSSNYKKNKEKNFEYEIVRIAKQVEKTKIEAKLDPMNSYKRRIVHTIVSEFKNLESSSVGEVPERYVIIKYKED